MRGFGAKIILDGQTMTAFWRSNNGQAGRESGWRITCKNCNKYKIKLNKFALHEKANGN